MRDLRIGGLVPLPVGMRTDVNLDVAVSGQLHLRLLVSRHNRAAPRCQHGCTVRTLLNEKRNADADLAAVSFRPFLPLSYFLDADRFDGAPQAFRVITAVEMLSENI